jgi:subtilisin family serine protease
MRGRTVRRRTVLVASVVVASLGSLLGSVAGAEPLLPIDPTPAEAPTGQPGGAVVPGEYIVTLAPNVPDQAVEGLADDLAADADAEVLDTFTEALDGFALSGVAAADVEGLQDDPRVESVQPNGVVSVDATQTTTGWFSSNLWGLDRIDEPDLPVNSQYTYDSTAGAGVEVYVLDTGVRPTHEDVAGRATAAFDAYDGTADDTNGLDCHGHGTHVAGTVAGGITGVAKAATITGVRVLACNGMGDDARIVAGLNYAITDHASGPAVINMSIGGSPAPAVDTAVNNAIADGITVVVAAGNEDANACGGSPSRVANAITVAASDQNDARSVWNPSTGSASNWGSCVDVFAPGTFIISASIEDDQEQPSDEFYVAKNGTSMASPHVAGAAALYLADNPGATPAQVWSALQASSLKGVLQAGTLSGSPNRLLYVNPTALTPPGVPGSVIVSPANGSVTVSWTAASPGNSNLRGYRIYRDGSPLSSDSAAGSTSRVVSGLTNGTEYDFTVAAINATGLGPQSSVASGTPRTIPSAPPGLTATAGNQQVALSWGAAANGGAAITSYQVLRNGVQVHETADASTRSFLDTGRTNGVTYSYVVRAVNVAGQGTLSAAVQATPSEHPPTFTDVGADHPFFADIEWMAAEGISEGYQPGPTYRPGDAVSRQAMSAFMYRLAGSPAFADPASPTFGDVGTGNPFFTEIEWMAAEDITTGTAASPKPLYKPADPVSRGAMSAFMYRLAGSPGFTPPAANATTFADVSAGYQFYAQVEWMAAEQITTGTAGSPKPTYNPSGAVSRGAMSAFMHRLADGPGVGV